MRSLSLLLASIYLTLFSSLASSEPIYWSAKKGNLELMVLGSIHVGNESMYPLPFEITEFLEKSDGLILETDTRKTHDIKYPSYQHTVKDVVSDTQINQLVLIAKELNIAESTLFSLPPWSASLAIQMGKLNLLGYEPSQGVDHKLLYEAVLNEIPVIGLEPLQFQIDLIASLPNDGEDLLFAALDEYHQNEEMTKCLVETWKAGDSEKLLEFGINSEISDDFVQLFITQRNEDWANKLNSDEFIESNKGRYLVVVGALHLVGKNNLIDGLHERGFAMEKRSKNNQVDCEFI
ncbi:TraB/GumN family protein [Vibrio sp. ZSDE26]|uniref:TraB/GumN family protein n=1 Tax=Vibrio amylolyticus TaxID=2847292 RepID=A0A9X2BH64_9VIBR|nr:TraB/GumN family protein [Vibrio amylolyticus]MCK6262625.1 TraB/GumN family protein [Vibrio amylolyticus]